MTKWGEGGGGGDYEKKRNTTIYYFCHDYLLMGHRKVVFKNILRKT